MSAEDETRSETARAVVDLLAAVRREQAPAVEVLTIDAVAQWLVSDANPRSAYGQDHAGQVLSIVVGALGDAEAVELDRVPDETPAIAAARDRLVAGAHELAALGERGATLLVDRAIPALQGELARHEGGVGAQLRSAYVFTLFAVTAGDREQGEEEVMRGLVEAYAGWDALFADGWTVPWRRRT